MWILEYSFSKEKKSDLKNMFKPTKNSLKEMESIVVSVSKNEDDKESDGFISFSLGCIYYGLSNQVHFKKNRYFSLLLEQEDDIFVLKICNKEYDILENLKKESKNILWYFKYIKYKILASKTTFLKSRSLETMYEILKKSEEIGLKINKKV